LRVLLKRKRELGAMKKVTWNDLHEGTAKELKKTYKLSDRQLEHALRNHLDGAVQSERRYFYQTLYGKRK
jgi:hypothetical protein